MKMSIGLAAFIAIVASHASAWEAPYQNTTAKLMCSMENESVLNLEIDMVTGKVSGTGINYDSTSVTDTHIMSYTKEESGALSRTKLIEIDRFTGEIYTLDHYKNKLNAEDRIYDKVRGKCSVIKQQF